MDDRATLHILNMVHNDLKQLWLVLESPTYGLSPYWQTRLLNTISLVNALEDELK